MTAVLRLDAAEIGRDEEFARWLEEEYVPLAGTWHY